MAEMNDYAKSIFEHIDDCFTDEIGPVAPILCEEAVLEWQQELEQLGQQRSLRSIPLYIEKLANNISDPVDKERFRSAAFDIDALRIFKK